MTAISTAPAVSRALNAVESNSASLPHLAAWELEREVYRSESCSIYRGRPRQATTTGPADYAIKLLHGDLTRERIARFRQEAWIGMHVKHAHLLPVFSAHCSAPSYYQVMPFIAGANVRQVLASAGKLNGSRAVWIARQMAEALMALHALEWLHGDVKPANIMLSREGHATLIDFGFARKSQQGRPPVDGPLMASVAYAAPELFTADSVTTAADIYSLSVSLFEMLTGQLPFEGTSVEELANAHLCHAPRDLRQLNPAVPQQLAWILRRALAKQPLRRPSAEELRDALAQCEIEMLHEWCQSR